MRRLLHREVMRESIWTDEADDCIKQLWNAGFSASEISKALFRDLRIHASRNAVIGRLHRRNLGTHERSRRNNPTVKPKISGTFDANRGKVHTSARKSKVDEESAHATLLASFREDATRTDLVPLAELGGSHCRWPIGDPKAGRFGFCGRRRLGGGSYCPDHTLRAHTQLNVANHHPAPAKEREGHGALARTHELADVVS